MALQFERSPIRITNKRKVRLKSEVSLEMWEDTKARYPDFFRDKSICLPKSVETIQALLYLSEHRPDIDDVSFLIKDVPRKQLAGSYESAELSWTLLSHQAIPTLSKVIQQAKLAIRDYLSVNEHAGQPDNVCIEIARAALSLLVRADELDYRYLAEILDGISEISTRIPDSEEGNRLSQRLNYCEEVIALAKHTAITKNKVAENRLSRSI